MFHLSNFGKFGEGLKRFADVNGCVPESGDRLDHMAYPNTPEDWEEFVGHAVEATVAAQKQVTAWQEGPRKPGRPPNKYKQGDGAPRLTVRIDDPDKREWVRSYPGGLAAIVDEAYKRSNE